MSFSIYAVLGGENLIKGTRPAKACHWDVSVHFVMLDGTKHLHSFSIDEAWSKEVSPLICGRVEALRDEHGYEVRKAGWTAHARGPKAAQKKKRKK
jgi:hypothetical protein